MSDLKKLHARRRRLIELTHETDWDDDDESVRMVNAIDRVDHEIFLQEKKEMVNERRD